ARGRSPRHRSRAGTGWRRCWDAPEPRSLRAVALPKSTSDLAAELDQSMPAVSAHLAVLRRAGLVSSWRAGRRVLYQLTPLARSVLAASSSASATPAEPA